MRALLERKIRKQVERELGYLEHLADTSKLPSPTPNADQAFLKYLQDSLAWLDEGAE